MAETPFTLGTTWTGERWVAVGFAGRSVDGCAVFDELGDLWVEYGDDADRILLDVPVGLPEDEPTRRCDELARAVLGPRADALPSPPVREAVRKRRFAAAERVHRRHTGADLSEAGFALAPAIVAVEDLLSEAGAARRVLVESHPELCFRAFADEPLSHPRTVAAGYAERLRTLASFDRDAPPTVQRAAEDTAGEAVSVADVLDAVALAYTARPGEADLRSLPPSPPADAQGRPMRLAYRRAAPLVDG